MARKFGKKNIVKIDPFAYNIGLFGESGIGKSTLVVEMCEKYLGEDGYIIYNIGKEDGIDAIQGAVYEDIKTWSDLVNINNDIIKNKNTDYKDLRVVVLDTIDELHLLGKTEVIRLNNLMFRDKPVKTFNASFGGFGQPQEELSKLILSEIARLKAVGISVIIVGHVKNRTLTDVTGVEYDVITSKIPDRLFVDIKTKLHVLGLAHIDRNVEKELVGKDIMGKEKFKNVTTKEKRVITFRDDNFAIDSKSRFAEITPRIDFSTDNFYDAILDAITKAFNKKDVGVTMEEAKATQAQEFENKTTEAVNKAQNEVPIGDMVQKIYDIYSTTTDTELKKALGAKVIASGVGKITELVNHDYDSVLEIYELVK